MADHGFQVRIATAPLPQGTVIIDRRTMILTDPAPAGAYALFEAAWDTYRRRVAELLTSLDAASRFQAGVCAGELGLTRR